MSRVSEFDRGIFPDTKRQSYVLPIKKQVRTAEHLEVGKPVKVALRLVDV